MAPTVVRNCCFRLFFFSREEPRVHVHVAHPDREATFRLQPGVTLAGHTGLSQQALAATKEVVLGRLEEIIDAWNRSFVG